MRSRRSPLVSKIYAAPGNPGIARHAECLPLAMDDLDGLRKIAVSRKIDLTVVGPEAPLAAGLTDLLTKEGLLVCGPDRAGAQMEGSKIFMKTILRKYGIPTASFKVFEEYDEAEQYLLTHRLPVVVKADGLAAGKGVAGILIFRWPWKAPTSSARSGGSCKRSPMEKPSRTASWRNASGIPKHRARSVRRMERTKSPS